jgi:CspA family cold shock protein
VSSTYCGFQVTRRTFFCQTSALFRATPVDATREFVSRIECNREVFGVVVLRRRDSVIDPPVHHDDCFLTARRREEILKDLGRQGYRCMASGTVKWFDETKGYGFIRPSDGGKDVFVHITAVRTAGLQTLAEGQKVNFDLVSERGKTAAGNLSLA